MLTEAQRRNLLAQLRPLVKDALTSELGPLIQAEIRGVSGGASINDGSYLARILRGSAPERRSSELPEAARVFARLGLIQAASQGNRATALDMAKTLDAEDHYRKAMSAGSAEGGGLLIIDQMADDLIELLRPFSVMRRIGAIEVPIPRGLKITPRIDVGVTSGYVAEGQAIPSSDIKTGAVTLTAK
jgi:HK97 family phage major capsid protein